MTARKVIEYVVLAKAFAEAPQIGSFLGTRNGRTVTLVSQVRTVHNNGNVPALRIFGERIQTAALPPDAEVMPWPKRARSRAAEPPSRVGPFPITSPAAARKRQRDRVIELRNDGGHIVPSVQIATGKVEPGEWVDPDDLNPRRREARRVSSFRAIDPIRSLEAKGSISRQQAHAARHLRRDFELGVIGLSRGVAKYDADAVTANHAGDGPSESLIEHLRYFTAAEAAVGKRLFDVIRCCVLLGETLLDYATRLGINRLAASGRLGAALDRLIDWYDSLADGPAGREARKN